MSERVADPNDLASEVEDKFRQAAIQAARGDIPPGIEGECIECGEWHPRLIGGACAPCRDALGLG